MNHHAHLGFIGTYTKEKSEGIYSFRLDYSNKQIVDIKLASAIENPTYLAVSTCNKYLYSVVKEGERGGLASFKMIPQTGQLIKINEHVLPGAAPCHVSVDKLNMHLLSANYHKGTVDSYLLSKENGAIVSLADTIKLEGSSLDNTLEKAHTHYAAFTPDEQFVAVIDLGLDQLITYIARKDGKLKEINTLSVSKGSGPRHLVFHPNQRIAYLMTEHSSEVYTLYYENETGTFKTTQTISTISKHFTGHNQGSAIQISSDGRFVYAANRGENSIAIFRVDPGTYTLSFVDSVSTEGDWPRDFSLDPTGNFLIAANQNSHDLTLFERDQGTGLLSLIEKNIYVPEPVCVKFV